MKQTFHKTQLNLTCTLIGVRTRYFALKGQRLNQFVYKGNFTFFNANIVESISPLCSCFSLNLPVKAAAVCWHILKVFKHFFEM